MRSIFHLLCSTCFSASRPDSDAKHRTGNVTFPIVAGTQVACQDKYGLVSALLLIGNPSEGVVLVLGRPVVEQIAGALCDLFVRMPPIS